MRKFFFSSSTFIQYYGDGGFVGGGSGGGGGRISFWNNGKKIFISAPKVDQIKIPMVVVAVAVWVLASIFYITK